MGEQQKHGALFAVRDRDSEVRVLRWSTHAPGPHSLPRPERGSATRAKGVIVRVAKAVKQDIGLMVILLAVAEPRS